MTRERERHTHTKTKIKTERSNLWKEKKIIKYKMQMKSNRINIHSYYSNFGYLDNFGLTDVEDLWGKICKICCFLYFAKFYKGWCELLLVSVWIAYAFYVLRFVFFFFFRDQRLLHCSWDMNNANR